MASKQLIAWRKLARARIDVAAEKLPGKVLDGFRGVGNRTQGGWRKASSAPAIAALPCGGSAPGLSQPVASSGALRAACLPVAGRPRSPPWRSSRR